MVSSYTSSAEMSQQNSRSDQYLHKSSSSEIYKKPQHSLATAGSRPQPKVYKVKPIHFRELVQQLTGAPAQAQAQAQTQAQTQAQNRRSNLQSIAPPPLPVHHNHHQVGVQNQTHNMSITQQQAPADQKPSLFGGFDSTTELTLSPNFQAWFAFAMLSPGAATVSQMEQRALV